LRYERGRLATTTPSLTQRLHALARQGASVCGEGDLGGTLELSRDEGRPTLLAHIFPLAANRTASIFDTDRPAAAVSLTIARPILAAKSAALPQNLNSPPRPSRNHRRKRDSCRGRAVED